MAGKVALCPPAGPALAGCVPSWSLPLGTLHPPGPTAHTPNVHVLVVMYTLLNRFHKCTV